MDQSFPQADRAVEIIAHRFRLLADPTRLRILQQLKDGEKNVNELIGALNCSQANVSKHLSMLNEGGLLTRRKVGATIFYQVADQSLFTICEIVCHSLREFNAEVGQVLNTP